MKWAANAPMNDYNFCVDTNIDASTSGFDFIALFYAHWISTSSIFAQFPTKC